MFFTTTTTTENSWSERLKELVIQARAGRARAITQYRGMDSYLPWVINQSEIEILNSCCKKSLSRLRLPFWKVTKLLHVSEVIGYPALLDTLITIHQAVYITAGSHSGNLSVMQRLDYFARWPPQPWTGLLTAKETRLIWQYNTFLGFRSFSRKWLSVVMSASILLGAGEVYGTHY
jgi:hypothetical protein